MYFIYLFHYLIYIVRFLEAGNYVKIEKVVLLVDEI